MQININKLRIHACHGVLPMERVVGQDFEVSVRLDVDYDGRDELESTVNYAEVCALVTREMQQPSALIEHAATRLCRAIREAFPMVKSGELTLAKLAPPMPFALESVSVSMAL